MSARPYANRLAALGAALATAALAASPAHAWCRMATSLRMPTPSEPCIFPDPSAEPPEHFLEWLRPCSAIALSVEAPSDDLTQDEVAGVLTRAIETWEAVRCDGSPLGVDIGILAETTVCTDPLYRDDGGNVNAVMFVHDWAEREYDPRAFAVTTVWHRRSTGEILDVDIEINERRGPYGICPVEGCSGDTVDLQNVLTHEIGHYLGLAHSTDPDATMFESAAAGETSKRELDEDDVAGICAVYPPGRPEGECDFTPRGGLVLHCETGCAVTAPGRDGAPAPWIAAALGLVVAVARRRR